MIVKRNEYLSRDFRANPHCSLPLKERLKQRKSVDLSNNRIIIDQGNGYHIVKTKDPLKRF